MLKLWHFPIFLDFPPSPRVWPDTKEKKYLHRSLAEQILLTVFVLPAVEKKLNYQYYACSKKC